ncbi:MAG: hypothetical protein KAS04_01775 [Candidatus Aenigmarchaeota archaeon]|nr:hypothetical protein [Candidatus Aenigmarchaeota archaeon]
MISQNSEIYDTKRVIRNIISVSKNKWNKIERDVKMKHFVDKKNVLISQYFFHEYKDSIYGELSKPIFKPYIKERKNHRVFLPPTKDKKFLPLLTFEWNHNKGNWDWKFILDILNTEKINTENVINRTLSLRYETSHDEKSIHNFSHVQINNKIFGSDKDSYTLSWLPKSHPHILLRSDKYHNSPVILLIFLLASLYSFKDIPEFLRGIHEDYHRKDMKKYFTNM